MHLQLSVSAVVLICFAFCHDKYIISCSMFNIKTHRLGIGQIMWKTGQF